MRDAIDFDEGVILLVIVVRRDLRRRAVEVQPAPQGECRHVIRRIEAETAGCPVPRRGGVDGEIAELAGRVLRAVGAQGIVRGIGQDEPARAGLSRNDQVEIEIGRDGRAVRGRDLRVGGREVRRPGGPRRIDHKNAGQRAVCIVAGKVGARADRVRLAR